MAESVEPWPDPGHILRHYALCKCLHCQDEGERTLVEVENNAGLILFDEFHRDCARCLERWADTELEDSWSTWRVIHLIDELPWDESGGSQGATEEREANP